MSQAAGVNLVEKLQLSTDKVLRYVASNSLRLHPAQQKLIELTMKHQKSFMLSSADEIQLLQNICRAIRARKTLDIGVYTGYSAMSIAMALPEDGRVVGCDITDEFPKMGIPFWKEAGVDQKISLAIGPAADSLQKLISDGEAGTFDFAFIDADKVSYDAYYELCLQLLRPGGIIAIDNMLWYGSVCDPESPEFNSVNTRTVRDLAKKIHSDERVDMSFLTAGDGTVLAFKR